MNWLPRVLQRIHGFAVSGAVRLTYKAEREVVALGLTLDDARDVLAGLRAADSAGRFTSERTGEWMYVFKPLVRGQVIYIKIVLREGCVVVSFHGNEGNSHEEDE